MSRFVRPETVRLDLTDNDWIDVKRRLTAGEERHAHARILKQTPLGERMALDFEQVGLAMMVAYLLDWSLVDDAGRAVVIRDQPPSSVEAILLNLDRGSFAEIHEAITKHEAAQLSALDTEKKSQAGVTKSFPISTAVG